MTTPPSGHVLIAPDKFKGSLSAFQVAERTAAGLVRAGFYRGDGPLPVADGGERKARPPPSQ